MAEGHEDPRAAEPPGPADEGLEALEVACPAERSGHVAVGDGRRMFVWGGYKVSGATHGCSGARQLGPDGFGPPVSGCLGCSRRGDRRVPEAPGERPPPRDLGILSCLQQLCPRGCITVPRVSTVSPPDPFVPSPLPSLRERPRDPAFSKGPLLDVLPPKREIVSPTSPHPAWLEMRCQHPQRRRLHG